MLSRPYRFISVFANKTYGNLLCPLNFKKIKALGKANLKLSFITITLLFCQKKCCMLNNINNYFVGVRDEVK